MPHFEKTSVFEIDRETAFRWHESPRAFQRLMPPWQEARILKCEGLRLNEEVITEVKVGPLWQKWVAHIDGFQSPDYFSDVQISGPFRTWRHKHLFAQEKSATRITDSIDYELPFGFLGSMFGGHYAAENLQRLFDYRHRILSADFDYQVRYSGRSKTILLTGASGLVGSTLKDFLITQGHKIISVRRGKKAQKCAEDEVVYDSESEAFYGLDRHKIDAVVHLAGESIASGRWNDELKQRIYDSRINMSRHLVDAISRLKDRPQTLISASATGFYGDRKDEELSEGSLPGQGFLPKVCVDWEAETRRAEEAGIRVVQLRIGIVLTPRGGALQKMLPAFRFGLGGVLGSGEQWMNWICLDDLIYLIGHSVESDKMSGPYNAVAGSLRNRDFTKILAQSLHRLTGPKAPAGFLKTFAGEMADALLLASTRVVPQRTLESQFHFRYEHLQKALRHILGISE